ncbi:methylated-DNA--[protein]-cysteine S-methyltransferase [Frondihabitans cladoniiphilus]|uniref:Methylated-DNA--[protein]-cysteine S-methyltransferase n=1 Tax=Frondihabitans cladoniiphilus TaxID=715785 RepID=A0ABP8VNA0_9MICO
MTTREASLQTPPASLASAGPPAADTGFAIHDSPLGRLGIHTRHGAVTRLDVERAGVLPHEHLVLQRDEVIDETRRQLDEYFAGTRRQFALPLRIDGTPFQNEVWTALTRVTWGAPTTYGALGSATGRPTGARAVGGAVRANPVALLVPCHRVLGAGRRVTGYSAGNGVPTKTWLLRHEGIDFVE